MPRSSERIANRKRTYDKMMTKYESTTENFEIIYSTLETINDDCLRHIAQYFNVIDALNFASTCSRFHNFAKTCIYSRKAKRICIADIQSSSLTATLDGSSEQLKLNSFESVFSCLGKFVVDLTFELEHTSYTQKEKHEIWRKCVIMVEQCQNLTKLRLKRYKLKQKDTRELQCLIERFQNIKELDFVKCVGLTNNWSAPSGTVSKVERLSLSTTDKIPGNFFEYFSNLSSLSIWFDRGSEWQTSDVTKIFDINGNSLKNLKLSNLSALNGNVSDVGRLITDKLHKLESLELGFELSEQSKILIELPHLRSLVVWSHSSVETGFLRTLSDKRTIEELKIFKCAFEDEGEIASPLIFNKLKSFCWKDPRRMSSFLKTMNKSQMPVIHTFELKMVNPTRNMLNRLLTFIESKKTLKLLLLYFHGKKGQFEPIEFFRQILNILQESRRPFLSLNLWHNVELGAEVVS